MIGSEKVNITMEQLGVGKRLRYMCQGWERLCHEWEERTGTLPYSLVI